MKDSPRFQSFLWGGFESATHGRRDGKRIDTPAAAGHDRLCAEDYRLLAQADVRTVRDALRWHLIETAPYTYDWSSFLPMLQAAHDTGTQVVWDLCHWGVPEGLDPFAVEFADRFSAFAYAAATLIAGFNARHGISQPPVYCPVNEISFWSWVGGDVEHFYPYGCGRGAELKRQLVRASVAAIDSVRRADASARFVQAEPIVQISRDPLRQEDAEAAARYTAAQFEAWDMLCGKRSPELQGSAEHLDVIGVNYYWNNQWIHEGERTPPGHPQHRALHLILLDVWQRYRRPIVITETGVEGEATCGWLAYVCSEVRHAQRMGVEIMGICLYPVMDYPGWDDERHCSCGLIESTPDWKQRSLRMHVCDELALQQSLFRSSALTKTLRIDAFSGSETHAALTAVP